MAMPRILEFDLETLPNIVTAFGLKVYGEYINPEAILKERSILCASWKWYGKPKVYSIDVFDARKRGREADAGIISKMSDVLNSADAVVAHNGDNFDMKWLHTRAVLLGLPPIKPVIQIDTYKIAKAKFNFNSNKLDYCARYLKVGCKIKTDFHLWLDSLEHNDAATRHKAVEAMVRYNRQDVIVLEGVYEKLRPFVPSKINHALFQPDQELAERTCPTCGDTNCVKKGYSYTRAGARHNMRCSNPKCLAWSYKRVTERVALPR